MGDKHRPGDGADATAVERAWQKVIDRRRAVGCGWQYEAQRLQEPLVAARLNIGRIEVDDVPKDIAAGCLRANFIEVASVDL